MARCTPSDGEVCYAPIVQDISQVGVTEASWDTATWFPSVRDPGTAPFEGGDYVWGENPLSRPQPDTGYLRHTVTLPTNSLICLMQVEVNPDKWLDWVEVDGVRITQYHVGALLPSCGGFAYQPLPYLKAEIPPPNYVWLDVPDGSIRNPGQQMVFVFKVRSDPSLGGTYDPASAGVWFRFMVNGRPIGSAPLAEWRIG